MLPQFVLVFVAVLSPVPLQYKVLLHFRNQLFAEPIPADHTRNRLAKISKTQQQLAHSIIVEEFAMTSLFGRLRLATVASNTGRRATVRESRANRERKTRSPIAVWMPVAMGKRVKRGEEERGGGRGDRKRPL